MNPSGVSAREPIILGAANVALIERAARIWRTSATRS
jgi:hypothetical protein